MPKLAVNNITLHYEDAGQGAVLLFIHGLGSSAADWADQIAHFSGSYRVIAPDLRGHGASEQPAGPYSIKLFADDIAVLLKSLCVESAHVVGISLGGAIAFQFAADQPALTKTLTIVNSGPEMILRTFAQKLMIWQRLLIVRLLGLPKMGGVLAKRLFPGAGLESVRAGFAERFAKNQLAPYLASLHALIGWSVSAHLQEIRCPVLVIAADQDYTPVALKKDYVAKIANARLAVIADSHHALPMERPAEFNRVLEEFLAARA